METQVKGSMILKRGGCFFNVITVGGTLIQLIDRTCALTESHRTVMDHGQLETNQLAQLTTALKQQMLKEIRENQPEKV